jgi:hypothetical protein
MKRFIVSILSVSAFFILLGGVVDRAGANFKSDERALELIKQARTAIGGDANIANVKALTITARTTKNFTVEGTTRSEQGETEINMQLPGQFSKRVKFGSGSEAEGVRENVDVIITRKDGELPSLERVPATDGEKKVFIMKKGEGEPVILNEDEASADGKARVFIRKIEGNDGEAVTDDGKKVLVDKMRVAVGGLHQKELFRTALALLLTAPEGTDVSYTYAGEGDVDGNSCDIVLAQTGGESVKLYLDKSTHLPRMMSYQSMKPFVIKINKNEANGEKEIDRLAYRSEKQEAVEFQVKFSDYRSVGGVQMPFRWTQTVGGQLDESVDVTNYEINPANIGERFKKQGHRITFRTEKPQ